VTTGLFILGVLAILWWVASTPPENDENKEP